MTQDLKARIMKWAEFKGYPLGSISTDLALYLKENDVTAALHRGSNHENARLQPLIEALADIIQDYYLLVDEYPKDAFNRLGTLLEVKNELL